MKLKTRITRAFLIIIIALVLFFVGTMLIGFNVIRGQISDNNEKLQSITEENTTESMNSVVESYMTSMSESKASEADQSFVRLKSIVENMAGVAEELYDNSENYPHGVQVAEPDATNDGVLSTQILYAKEYEATKASVKEEGLLGHAALMIKTVNANNDAIASNYLASEKGFVIMADYTSASKFGENGEVAPNDPRTRPWYIGAKDAAGTYFTSVTLDAHGNGSGIMCGAPFYNKGEFAGVAGAGMYLNNIQAMVEDENLTKLGKACIINEAGQVIFSGFEESIFATKPDDLTDVRDITEGDLNALFVSALNGESGLTDVDINGTNYYIAYAPMKTVGWSFLTVVEEQQVLAPTVELLATIGEADAEANAANESVMVFIFIITIIAAIAAIVVSLIVAISISKSISNPINNLTTRVQEISGENLDFKYDFKASGETHILATSFETLTKSLKKYISEITEITAEKERIGAELNVATKIQADMLPSIFPAFPRNGEFDVYASMDPAKEVGGDFYDFFMVDDRHLALVMADVSGKGVPAALFMVISKTLLKNNAMQGISPSEVLYKTNNELCQGNDEMMFVTVWLGILDIETGELTYANGGHEYPAVMRAGGDFELVIEEHDLVLAAMEGVPFKEHSIKLNPGDRLFVYTDGVPEATSTENELYGTDRMLDILNANKTNSLENMLKSVRADIDKFAVGAPQFDDITMLGFDYMGAKKVELTVPATDEELVHIQSVIETELEKNNCNPATTVSIMIAVEEIFVNIAHYAYQDEPDQSKHTAIVNILVDGEPKKISMEFIDRGIPYNPLEKEDPDITLSAEERGIGGLGIYMVKQSMDEVRYVHEDGCNKLTLIKTIE